jgi:hypothetical protein
MKKSASLDPKTRSFCNCNPEHLFGDPSFVTDQGYSNDRGKNCLPRSENPATDGIGSATDGEKKVWQKNPVFSAVKRRSNPPLPQKPQMIPI